MGFDEDVDIIISQTGITSRETVENCYIENKYSIADTIMHLMKYEYAKKPIVKPRTTVDDFREIVEAKEKVYYEIFNAIKKQRENEVVTINECSEDQEHA